MNRNTLILGLLGLGVCAWLVVPYTLADHQDHWPTLAQVQPERDAERPPVPPGPPGGGFGPGREGRDLPPRPGAGQDNPARPGAGPGANPDGPPRGPGMEGGVPPYGRGGPMGPVSRLLHSSPEIQQMDTLLQTVMRMRQVAFMPESAGLIAVGGLKDDRRKPQEIIEDLESLLKETKTLGLRNSIRLTLRDLYRAQKQDDKALAHLRTMLRENDDAIQAELKSAAKR